MSLVRAIPYEFLTSTILCYMFVDLHASKNGSSNVQIFHILFIDDTGATALSSRWFMSRAFKKLVVHNLQVVVEKCLSSLVTTASLLLVFQATCFETECIILPGHQTNQVGERMVISFLLQYLQSVECSSISTFVCRLILQEPSESYSKMQLILPFGCTNRDE